MKALSTEKMEEIEGGADPVDCGTDVAITVSVGWLAVAALTASGPAGWGVLAAAAVYGYANGVRIGDKCYT